MCSSDLPEGTPSQVPETTSGRNSQSEGEGTIATSISGEDKSVIRDVCEFSLQDALLVEKQFIIDMIPNDKCIYSNCVQKPSGKPPTNLIKCYNNDSISFKTRTRSTYSGIEDIDEPSHTILCTYARMPRLFIPMRNGNGLYLRPFTISELQQLQGFPKEFQFCGSYTSIIKQIGNAIPPGVVTTILSNLFELKQ